MSLQIAYLALLLVGQKAVIVIQKSDPFAFLGVVRIVAKLDRSLSLS
jgi:hypothetical protein